MFRVAIATFGYSQKRKAMCAMCSDFIYDFVFKLRLRSNSMHEPLICWFPRKKIVIAQVAEHGMVLQLMCCSISTRLLMCSSIIFSVLCFIWKTAQVHLFCKIANLKGLNLNDNSIELEHKICSICLTKATEKRMKICCIILILWMSDPSTSSTCMYHLFLENQTMNSVDCELV